MGSNARVVLFIALAAAALLSPTDSAAIWPTDPSINVPVVTAVEDQNEFSLTRDSYGGAFLAWQDYRTPGAFDDVYAQHIDATGTPRWTPDGVAVAVGTWNQYAVRVVADGAGGCIVFWTDDVGGTVGDLYAQRLDMWGNPLWGAGGKPICTASGTQYAEVCIGIERAEPGLDGAIVLFRDGRNGDEDLFLQWVDLNGNLLLDPSGLVVCTATGDQLFADMTYMGEPGIVMVWRDDRYFASLGIRRIYAQLFDGSTTVWAPNGVSVNASTENQQIASVVSSEDGFAVVVWQADIGSTPLRNVFAQRIESINGAVLWDPTGVSVTDSTQSQVYPNAVADGAGGAIICWEDRRVQTGDIYAQRLDASGSEMWTHHGVPVNALGGSSPGLYSYPMVEQWVGRAIIVWRDYAHTTPGESDIYAQQLDFDGTPMWAVNGIPVSSAPSVQTAPQAVTDEKGGLVAAWLDYRNALSSGVDIYTQQVSDLGQPGVVSGVRERAPAASVGLRLGANYPNPFTGTTAFDYHIDRESDVRVEVFDVRGRRVSATRVGLMPAGAHRHEVSSRDQLGRPLPSGVYYYRVTTGGVSESRKMVVLR